LNILQVDARGLAIREAYLWRCTPLRVHLWTDCHTRDASCGLPAGDRAGGARGHITHGGLESAEIDHWRTARSNRKALGKLILAYAVLPHDASGRGIPGKAICTLPAVLAGVGGLQLDKRLRDGLRINAVFEDTDQLHHLELPSCYGVPNRA